MTFSPSTPPANSAGTGDAVFDVTLDFPARLVGVSGELDLATAPLLLGALETLLADPLDDLTIDLAKVGFLDSVGLGTFAHINNTLRSYGYRLILINPTAQQRRLFLIAGLASLLAAS